MLGVSSVTVSSEFHQSRFILLIRISDHKALGAVCCYYQKKNKRSGHARLAYTANEGSEVMILRNKLNSALNSTMQIGLMRLLFSHLIFLVACVQYDLSIDFTCNKIINNIIARAIYVRNTILNFNSHFKFQLKFQSSNLNFKFQN